MCECVCTRFHPGCVFQTRTWFDGDPDQDKEARPGVLSVERSEWGFEWMHCLWSGTMLMIMRMMYEEEEVAVLVSTVAPLY